jgi:hypothetical protein
MSRWLRLTPLLLVLALLWGGEVAAQRQWPNDVSGRPAPPCTIYDPVANTTTFCSATAPLPVSGGGAGTGSTTGTSVTGFGKQWFPSTITGSVASGQQMAAFFLDDLNVAFLRRSTGCGNCLQVAVSSDGGVTATFVNTSVTLGNSIRGAARISGTTPRYLVSSVGGPLNVFVSTNVLSGWVAVTGLTSSVHTFAGNPTGSTILALTDTGGGQQVCRSTTNGTSFGGCVTVGASGPGGDSNQGLAFAGGTTWLAINNGGNILRSIDDGVSWSTATTIGTGRGIVCLAPNYTTCIYATDTSTFRSTDSGATWSAAQLVTTAIGGLCDFGGGANVGVLANTPPTGFAAIAQNAESSFDAGVNWFQGQTNGSPWDGTGVPTIGAMACRNGRGVATIATTGGGTNVFSLYNPLTSPGGTLQSSAGGYSIVTPAQGGIILNAAPTTSGANAAATITLTGTAGSRICIREIVVFSSAAGTPTLVIQDATVTQVNYGTLATGTAPTRFAGAPLFCGQTNDSLQVVVGAAGAGVTTTTSVIADRYPN